MAAWRNSSAWHSSRANTNTHVPICRTCARDPPGCDPLRFESTPATCSQKIQSTKGCTTPAAGLTAGNVFGIEFIATFLLVFTVFGTAVDPKSGAGNFAPIAIGFSLFAAAYGIGGVTGAGLNPARTLCPAIVAESCWKINDTDTYAWAYAMAQFLGGAAAGIVYTLIFLNRPDDGQKRAVAAFTFMANETRAIKKRLDNVNL